MALLTNILSEVPISATDNEWIHRLVGDWQVISDLAFADLLLVFVTKDGRTIVAAHCRPATASTHFDDDVVGTEGDSDFSRQTCLVMSDGQVRQTSFLGTVVQLYPIRNRGGILAVLALAPFGHIDRVPNQVTSDYETITHDLIRMVGSGEFPLDGPSTGSHHGTPRVADGFVHVDADGAVQYASPNALSNFHHLGVSGSLVGRVLVESVTAVAEQNSEVDEALPGVIMGKVASLSEIESHGTIVSLRSIPLTDHGTRLGAIILCRDVTEIRRREKALMTKDAIIREINHRVKNNLQTVSGLLRLQARRAKNDDTKQALEDAQQRVSTIALVHQILSQTIDDHVKFDDVFSPILRLASDSSAPGREIHTHMDGQFGTLNSNQTTFFAIAANELITNAVKHGLPDGGNIWVHVSRADDFLQLDIEDDGIGTDPAAIGTGLGTKIIRSLVAGELHGTIHWGAREGGGTTVHVTAHIDK
ncbi:MAG: histidine kinase N-terminal domain-containing protein [Actinomycetaceae bacterium]|nr:histidine kinase N-terminal domain-containing protein [Actinomycetaceae bacterium]MDY6083630.1 histidine kinase N-terminal domain-containing protein [Actinomycetaceae bacterium]